MAAVGKAVTARPVARQGFPLSSDSSLNASETLLPAQPLRSVRSQGSVMELSAATTHPASREIVENLNSECRPRRCELASVRRGSGNAAPS